MRVFPTTVDGARALGVLLDDDTAVVVPAPPGPQSPVMALLSGGAAAVKELRHAVSDAVEAGAQRPVTELPVERLIAEPVKILCVGFNYPLHASEMSIDVSARPNIFCKFDNSVIAPSEPIVIPEVSDQIDFEGELAIVIGRRCYAVTEAEALDYVGGYTAMNDVSARDLQFGTSQWTLGKAVDTFAPLGPVLTLAEAIPDPQQLWLTTRVNGEVLQDAGTKDMIFSVAKIISTISRSMTLECGDVIATGTPEGVGYKRTPPRFLRAGDTVEIEISGIGTLRNPVEGVLATQPKAAS